MNYVIGIGGTGHRFAKAVIHYMAVGIIQEDVTVVTMDPHYNTGELTDLTETVQKYRAVKNAINNNKNVFIGNLITPDDGKVVNISPLTRSQKTALEDEINYNAMSDDIKQIVDFLYTEEEKKLPLEVGFKGHPNIGTYIFSNGLEKNQTWNRLLGGMKSEDKVFIMGSFHGGTGASGVPVVTKIIRSKVKNIKIAVLLSTPYVSFVTPSDKEDGIEPNCLYFIPKTKSAVQIYKQQRFLDNVNAMYMIGERPDDFNFVDYDTENQKNPAHNIELFAASAFVDFLNKKDGVHSIRLMGREIVETQQKKGPVAIEWVNSWNMLDSAAALKFAVFMQMSILLTKILYHEYNAGDATGNWLSMYRNITSEDMSAFNEYMKCYINWFKEMAFTRRQGQKDFNINGNIKLFDFSEDIASLYNGSFNGSIKIKEFNNIILLAETKKVNNNIPSKNIYSSLCQKIDENDTSNIAGKFLNKLYALTANNWR